MMKILKRFLKWLRFLWLFGLLFFVLFPWLYPQLLFADGPGAAVSAVDPWIKVLGAATALSEALSLVPWVKANGIAQLIFSVFIWIFGFIQSAFQHKPVTISEDQLAKIVELVQGKISPTAAPDVQVPAEQPEIAASPAQGQG
jgi:hypothetical protein